MEALASRRSASRGKAGERTILVGTDGSDGADLAIDHAVAVASALGWNVVVAVVHSTEDRGLRGVGTSIGLREARAVLGDSISRHGAAFDSADGEPPSERTLRGVAVPGPVPKALLTLAQDEACDMVVVGNRRDAARAAGGLATTLAAEAPCDVLVVDTIDRRRPGYRRIGAAGVDIGGSLADLVRKFRAGVDSLPRPSHGRWPAEIRAVGDASDLSESLPYDLLVIDRDGARSRGALGRLIESARTNVFVLRTRGTDAVVGPGRRGKEQRMARGGPEALVDVPLFSSLTKRQLRHVAALTVEEHFEEGTSLAQENKPGDTFYILLEGEAKVVRNGRRIDRLIPGDFFGEIALIDGGPRTASVVATTPMTTMTIERKRFRKMLEEDPSIVVAMLEELAKRLRNNERSPTG